MSTSSATGLVVAEIHAEREQSLGYTTSRQPSATAAAARLPPEGPSLVFLYDVFHWFIFRFHLRYFVAFRPLLVKD